MDERLNAFDLLQTSWANTFVSENKLYCTRSDYVNLLAFLYNESMTLPTCFSVSSVTSYVFCKVRELSVFVLAEIPRLITHILNWLVVDDQTPGTLVQDAVEDLVENHLTESEERKESVDCR